MSAKKTYWTPLSGGGEENTTGNDFGMQPHNFEMAPLPSAMFKDSKLAPSTTEHTDHDPLLSGVGEYHDGHTVGG